MPSIYWWWFSVWTDALNVENKVYEDMHRRTEDLLRDYGGQDKPAIENDLSWTRQLVA